MEEKKLPLERIVFFSDAVVAIAITLLALDLRIDHIKGDHLTFDALLGPWKTYLAFILSFINIASFWKNHHMFFTHIKQMDERLLFINTVWLFFIVLLPFSTSLLSAHFTDQAAVFAYCLNIFLVSVCQNFIWDYSSMRAGFVNPEETDPETQSRLRLYCNLDMINGILAIALAFYSPKWAFILMVTKVPMFVLASFYLRGKKIRSKKLGRNYKKR